MFLQSARMSQLTVLIIIIGLGLLPDISQALPVVSTFDTDTEGWTVADWNLSDNYIVGTYDVNWDSAGEYINSSDPSSNDFFFAAPNKFLGNQSAAYGGFLQYDIFDQSEPQVTGYPAVMLRGGGQLLTFLGDGPGTIFKSSSVQLTAMGWVDRLTGQAATDAQMKNVLASLDGLFFYADWVWGPDLAGLDNVRFGVDAPTPAVPEPGTLLLLLSGTVTTVRLYRRRSRC